MALILIARLAMGQEMNCIENISCIPEVDKLNGQFVLRSADKMPQYPGGIEAMYKFIAKNIRLHGEGDVRGKILMTFIVDTAGRICNACVKRSCSLKGRYIIEEEITEIFKQLEVMQPGENEGKKVPVRISLPIAF